MSKDLGFSALVLEAVSVRDRRGGCRQNDALFMSFTLTYWYSKWIAKRVLKDLHLESDLDDVLDPFYLENST